MVLLISLVLPCESILTILRTYIEGTPFVFKSENTKLLCLIAYPQRKFEIANQKNFFYANHSLS